MQFLRGIKNPQHINLNILECKCSSSKSKVLGGVKY